MEGKSFDQMNPKPSVTDPHGLGAEARYPRHLHKPGVAEDNGPLYVEVRTPQQEAEAIAEGWLLEKPGPQADAGTARGAAPPRRR